MDWPTNEEFFAIRNRVRPKAKRGGYAATPGTGPPGETCKTCAHKTYRGGVKSPYIKCALMRAYWTHGPGTDIKAGAAACSKWKAIDDN